MKMIYNSKKLSVFYSLAHFSIGVNIYWGVIHILLPFFHINIVYNESKIPTGQG
jgi:hypothetical protein